ncbi:hypothetical protein SAMN02745784_00556 [Tissierella praeacuta DSM 18095]|uniref:Uncharacterized protein n=1 Tax=Tissierella praeacuta DSM 18095 TaxID=1123404 RepID=A0A1M4T882_9FIRM|nr:hypothetical protein [Tissierella praeacuta]SHE40723.1 hypothetical protein SAMN02745784_00556 [Tissierella praeacuta DSM 18095]SUP04856.1 Uncharacterised protein [Tissierella praeacuta]
MTEKAYFGEISAANNAIRELEKAGFSGAFVDINDHYIGNRNVKTNNPGTSTAPNLSQLILNSGSDSLDNGNSPLAAGNPMVSGMSSFEEIANINYVVSVNISGKDSQKARDILKDNGGYLGNPNISGEKAISNAEVDLTKAISTLEDDV